MTALPTLAVVGATGAVGTVMCELLVRATQRLGRDPAGRLARARPGAGVRCRGEELTVQALTPEAFDGVDVAMFDVPDEVSAEWAPIAVARGAVVVDNSGAFRMDPDVPLVVPEINPEQVRNRPAGHHRQRQLHHAGDDRGGRAAAPRVRPAGAGARLVPGGLRRRSGPAWTPCTTSSPRSPATGRSARARATCGRRSATTSARSRRRWRSTWCRGPARSRDGGWSSEELKIRNESRKILGLPDLKVSATCVRVPVVTGHSVAVHAVFGSEVDAEGAREVLRNAPGVILVDDPAAGEFPMPIDAVGTDPSWVGRIRRAAGRPARARPLRHRRQPAQGRRPQHRPDRRTPGQGTPHPLTATRPPAPRARPILQFLCRHQGRRRQMSTESA